MLRAIEDRGQDGIFVNVFKQSISVNELIGGELTADEVSMINSAYPNSIPNEYVCRSLSAQDDIEQNPENINVE